MLCSCMINDQREVLHHPFSSKHSHSESLPSLLWGVFLSPHGQSCHLEQTRGPSNLLPVRGKVYLKSQQEDAAQEPKQAVLRGALLALHCMTGGSAV